jgi:AcrR family transcriptional regulator
MSTSYTTETRERILQEAHDLFMQYGLKSVSMDDLSRKLGISKKTIYLHFSDKDALVKSVVERVLTTNTKLHIQERTKSINAIHEEFLIIELMGTLFKTMNPSILFDMQKYYPDAFVYFLQHKNNIIKGMIRENLQRGLEEGLYREEINLDILTRYRVESVVMPFNTEFQQGLKKELTELCREISIHFLYGIATTKGQKLIEKYKKSTQI